MNKHQEGLYDSLVSCAQKKKYLAKNRPKKEEKGNQHGVAFYNGAVFWNQTSINC